MPLDEDEGLQAILDLLLDGKSAVFKGAGEQRAATPADVVASISASDELDTGLRVMGLNYRERAQLRQAPPVPRQPKPVDRTVAVKRIAFYIDEQVDWKATAADRVEVIAGWAALCDFNVDRLVEWFGKGVEPLDLAEVRTVLDHGLQPADLFTVVGQGRTVLQHLRAGSSIGWCLLALDR